MAKKTLEYYLKLPYRVEIYPEEDGDGYTAKIPDLPGCMTSADTLDELWAMVEEAKELWLEVALEDGDYIPEPPLVEIQKYSGKFVVRLPSSLHRQLVNRAKLENTSLNQLVVMLLSEGMGRWTERRSFESVSGRHFSMHVEYSRTIKPFEPRAFQRLQSAILTSFKAFYDAESSAYWDLSGLAARVRKGERVTYELPQG